MSTYEPEQLLQLWKLDQIDSQMVIGHLLQNLASQQEAVKKMNTSLTLLRIDMNNLASQVKSPTSSTNPKKGGMQND